MLWPNSMSLKNVTEEINSCPLSVSSTKHTFAIPMTLSEPKYNYFLNSPKRLLPSEDRDIEYMKEMIS